MTPIHIDLLEIKNRIRSIGSPFHVGLTGGIASGKTTIANMFQKYGAHLIDFDLLSREVVEPGTKGLSDVVACFGKQILNPSGCLDRKALSRIVFKDPEKRKQLEAVLHPAIFELFCRRVEGVVKQEPGAVIFSVIPLLVEMKLQPLFHRVIVVHVSREIQRKRLMERDGIDEKTALNIMKSQLSIDEKLQFADFVVDNVKDLEHSRNQVEEIWCGMDRL